jgi:hypothetical protein
MNEGSASFEGGTGDRAQEKCGAGQRACAVEGLQEPGGVRDGSHMQAQPVNTPPLLQLHEHIEPAAHHFAPAAIVSFAGKRFAVGMCSLEGHSTVMTATACTPSILCVPDQFVACHTIAQMALFAGKRFAVGMCSLEGHQLAGEERFQVEMLPDGSVW